MSIQVRKRIEQGFGWAKTVGDLRKLPRVGMARVKGWEAWNFAGMARVKGWEAWNFAAYNLVRLGGIGEWWDPSPT